MDRRFLTVLGVSLLFALVISTVFYQMTARAGGKGQAAPSDNRATFQEPEFCRAICFDRTLR